MLFINYAYFFLYVYTTLYVCLFIYNAYTNLCYMMYNFWNPTCNMHHWCSQNPTSMFWFCQYHPGPPGLSTDRWDGGTFWTFFVWHVHSSGCLVSDGSEAGFLAWVACVLGEYLNDIPRKAFYWSGFSKLLSLFLDLRFCFMFLVLDETQVHTESIGGGLQSRIT